MKKRNRYISLLLCLSILLSTVVHSIPTVFAAERSVEITVDGQQADNITIGQYKKEVLLAVVHGMENPSFQ